MRGPNFRSILIAASLVTSCRCGAPKADVADAAPPAGSDAGVTDILAKVNTRYASAKTYRDEGTVRVVMHPQDKPERVVTARFSTVWRKPDRLRFELDEAQAQKLAIWTPEPGVVETLLVGKVEKKESIKVAISGQHGVTHGTSALVPLWLVDGAVSLPAALELRGMTACGAARCYELAGKELEKDTSWFFDTETYALRKKVARGAVKPLRAQPGRVPFASESTWELEPVFDAPVPDSAFDFKASSSTDR